MGMSQEELKRQNAEEEARSQQEPQADVPEELEAAEAEIVDSVDSEGSEEAQETTEETVEAWMQGDDQTSQDNETVPLGSHVNMRRKLKGQIGEKVGEIEQLKAKIEALEARKPVEQVATTARPKRDDYLDADDPEEAYIDALTDWKFGEQNKKAQAAQVQQQQEAAKADLESKLQSHYERAGKLLDDHNINADVYKSAETGFRHAIEAASPGNGDAVADMIISQIGDGSEKLVMYVGNSSTRREQLQAALIADPNGFKAMRLIGKWESETSAPTKRKSQAPKPAPQAKGDAKASGSVDALKRRYDKAHSSNNIQEAFNVKRQARAQKIDVSNW